MKTKLAFSLRIILAALFFQSCTGPQKITKLLPTEEPEKWLEGQVLERDSAYGVIYEIGFDRVEDGTYWFDFHITNRSNMPLLVDPTQFSCQAFDALMNPQTINPINAIDPEGRILQFDKDISRNDAVAKNHVGIVIMGIGASIAANVILGNDRNPDNDNLRYPITDGIMTAALASGDIARFESQNLNELKDAWEKGTIRKTTLNSNFSMHGKVFFPFTKDASYLKLVIPVDDQALEFSYKQIQFPVN